MSVKNREMRRHIMSPLSHDPLCGAKSKLALMNRERVERIYCDLLEGVATEPCLECTKQLSYTLSGGSIGANGRRPTE